MIRRGALAARLALVAAVASAACGPTDGERLADDAYAAGRYLEALSTYRELAGGSPDPRLLAKIGAAALRAGRLGDATDAYLHLAGEDPARSREAAAGLDAVARAAERSENRAALVQAVLGLQTVAPDAVGARYALALAQQPGAEADELVSLLPAALAAAGDGALVDSLLYRYARALHQMAGCGQALLHYRAVVRRAQDSALGAAGRAANSECALSLGQRARSAGRGDDAALWYAEAARVDSASATGRQALVSLGEVRLEQGDTLAAALAFQTAVSAVAGQEGDSIAQAARARLDRLGLIPSAGDDVRSDLP